MNIVIIEDSISTRNLLKDILSEQEHNIATFSSGKTALFHIAKNDIDFLLLDIGLPDMNGYELLEEIKKNQRIYGKPYTIMISSKTKEEEVIAGFEKGADDYIKKPFNPEELKLRIKAASRNFMKIHSFYKYDKIEIDNEAQVVYYNNKILKVTKTELKLLAYLIKNQGITISRKELYQNIWEGPFFEGNRTIDVYIRRLKIKFPILENNIASMNGVGYRLEKI